MSQLKKKALFLGLLLAFCVEGQAQEKGDWELQLNIGAAVPTGDLGESLNDKSGFAQTGRSIGFNLYAPIVKKVYLTFGYSNISMKVNRSEYDSYSENALRSSLSRDLYVTRNFLYKSSLENYSNNVVMVGLNFDIEINEKIEFYLNPTASYSWFNVPDVSIVVTDSLYSVGSSQTTDVEPSFGFQINGGVKFKASDQLKLNLQTAFHYSEHSFDAETSTVNQNNEVFVTKQVGNSVFSAFVFSIGLQFKLFKE